MVLCFIKICTVNSDQGQEYKIILAFSLKRLNAAYIYIIYSTSILSAEFQLYACIYDQSVKQVHLKKNKKIY